MNDIKPWERLNYFQSAVTSQKFLKQNYIKLNDKDPDQKSYENCLPFMYYLEHGEMYYKQAAVSPLALQPVLLFYGIIHLLKACILTVDPHYPASTSVLAHGVTSRKRKKQQYRFLEDEIRIQKQGLCTHCFEMLFHVKQMEGSKMSMNELLTQIPELDELFLFQSMPNMMTVLEEGNKFILPLSIIDHYQMTKERFMSYLKEKCQEEIQWESSGEEKLVFTMNNEKQTSTPFRYHYVKETYTLPKEKNNLNMMPELMIHYLLLYNLSMIARYETEWWCELLKTAPNSDYPFIKTFLEITAFKSPFLSYQFLEERRKQK